MAALGYVLQRDVQPSIRVATDRHLLAALGRRAATAECSGFTRFPVTCSPLDAGISHRRRPSISAKRSSAVSRADARSLSGEGYLGISLSCPHRSALIADDPLRAARRFRFANRYVRGLMRALEAARASRVLSGSRSRHREPASDRRREFRDRRRRSSALRGDRRRRPAARAPWRSSSIAGTPPVSSRATFSRSRAGTSLREEIGETPTVDELGSLVRDAFAEQFGVAIAAEPLSPLETAGGECLGRPRGTRSWSVLRQPRQDLPAAAAPASRLACSRRTSLSSRVGS